MFSNSFWYGFLIGVGPVFLVFAVSRMIIRAKRNADS
jgi:hypothetical protein